MDSDFFKSASDINPMIYAYTDRQYPGYFKVGYTDRDVEQRVKEQYPVLRPDDEVPYKIVFQATAMRPDGSIFHDTKVHHYLTNDLHAFNKNGEWFKCSLDDVKKAYHAAMNNLGTATDRINDFKMRPEQQAAVDKTEAYYNSVAKDPIRANPKFLWNAKMRFGKTFAAYELAKKMGLTKVLVVTFKVAVKGSWREDLLSHKDFEGWQFIARPEAGSDEADIDEQYYKADKSKPIVCFGSFMDLMGVDKETGQIKAHNEWIHTTNWDLVIFDEYHFGAWREKAKALFEKEDEETVEMETVDTDSCIDESFLPITTDRYLFLSGTPFKALNSGEFLEEQIFSWTYSDEQEAKERWNSPEPNPYASMPRIIMMTYKMPESITQIAMEGEYNEFDLNVFFSAKGRKDDAEFVFKSYIQKWLDLIRGSYLETSVDDLRLGTRPPFPFSDARLLSVLLHTLWFLPNVASCYAMKNLLAEPQNTFYHDFNVIVCAGSDAGQGAAALGPVQAAMADPLNSRSITLSCGKLTTGVTVKPWSGVFMLRNLSQPETYFQTAFRVQSPWVVDNEIIKEECYVFDFALNRTLRQLSEYSCNLNPNENNPEKKVGKFIKFLPVLAYDGGKMTRISAAEILDIAVSGTSATMLARRWESALLVNVDNATLKRLLDNPEALEALMKIEAFRGLNKDIQAIINKSEYVKKAKREGLDKKSPKEKKTLTEEEKEYKSKRKEIQEKLIKFATRIPIFMYLTDFREICLKDVITKLEPQLFKKVTGLEVKDFELLVGLGLFNDSLMNDAIYKFRRYEERSLDYTGIDRRAGMSVGGWNTSLSEDEHRQLYGTPEIVPNVPELSIGEEVEVKGHGRCIVDHFSKGKVILKTKDKGRKLDPYIYPYALTMGTIEKLKE